MNTPLHVTEVLVVRASCMLEFDEYVPLRFRSSAQPIGAGHIRLGNYSTTLIELMIEPASNLLRGMTVTSYEELSDWPDLAVISEAEGLPALSPAFDRTNRIDLKIDF